MTDDNTERALRAALLAGEVPACPSCTTPLDRVDVPPDARVSYVRRRVVLTCPSCHLHVALDAPRAP